MKKWISLFLFFLPLICFALPKNRLYKTPDGKMILEIYKAIPQGFCKEVYVITQVAIQNIEFFYEGQGESVSRFSSLAIPQAVEIEQKQTLAASPELFPSLRSYDTQPINPVVNTQEAVATLNAEVISRCLPAALEFQRRMYSAPLPQITTAVPVTQPVIEEEDKQYRTPRIGRLPSMDVMDFGVESFPGANF